MQIKSDLKEFIYEQLQGYVQSHIEAWVGHYCGMSAEEAAREFDINYDWRAELETIENDLGRELTIKEEDYIFNKYYELFKKNYYISMQRGYKLQTGYYLR